MGEIWKKETRCKAKERIVECLSPKFNVICYEWAREVEDILWRRSKLGMQASNATVEVLEKVLQKLKEEVLA